jgi:hypothetical protein
LRADDRAQLAATLLPLPGEVVPVVMVFIPTLVAFSLTAVTDGRSGVRGLLGKLAQWRVPPKWLVVALALGLVMRLAMSGAAVLATGWRGSADRASTTADDRRPTTDDKHLVAQDAPRQVRL